MYNNIKMLSIDKTKKLWRNPVKLFFFFTNNIYSLNI